MLTENEKRRMSDRCGWSKDQRTDDIKKGIRKTSYDNDEEHAVKRKTQKILIQIVKMLYREVFGEELSNETFSEFFEYHNTIENIKRNNN